MGSPFILLLIMACIVSLGQSYRPFAARRSSSLQMTSPSSSSSGQLSVDTSTGPRDGRDKLPFTIYLLKDKTSKEPVREVGTFLLDPTTSCGDFIELGVDSEFVVRRVTFVYRHGTRGLEVIRKKIDVTAVRTPRGFSNILQ